MKQHSKRLRNLNITILLSLMVLGIIACNETRWESRLESALPVYGHRNWIVIADLAYPKQSASGIETIYTDANHLEVIQTVLNKVHEAPHVQANVLLDAEMSYLSDEDVSGLDDYQTQLKELLKGKHVEIMPHEEIIHKLDIDSKVFNVLLLKTNMLIPYTSVFLQLDCGYWNAEQETLLREKMMTSNSN